MRKILLAGACLALCLSRSMAELPPDTTPRAMFVPQLQAYSLVLGGNNGTQFTISGCSATIATPPQGGTWGPTAGVVTSGTTGVCTVTVTMGRRRVR